MILLVEFRANGIRIRKVFSYDTKEFLKIKNKYLLIVVDTYLHLNEEGAEHQIASFKSKFFLE